MSVEIYAKNFIVSLGFCVVLVCFFIYLYSYLFCNTIWSACYILNMHIFNNFFTSLSCPDLRLLFRLNLKNIVVFFYCFAASLSATIIIWFTWFLLFVFFLLSPFHYYAVRFTASAIVIHAIWLLLLFLFVFNHIWRSFVFALLMTIFMAKR